MAKRKPKGFYQDRKNFDSELKKAEDRLERFPSTTDLRKLRKQSLVDVAYKYYGSWGKVREEFDPTYTNDRKLAGFWDNQENVLEEARSFMAEHDFDILPSEITIRKLGNSRLVRGIYRCGGFSVIRSTLGQQADLRNPRWHSLDYAIEQARARMKQNGWSTLPSNVVLEDRGYKDLVNAIFRYHGGFPAFREILHAELGIDSRDEQLESLLSSYTGGSHNG